jgi:hypothetical protein
MPHKIRIVCPARARSSVHPPFKVKGTYSGNLQKVRLTCRLEYPNGAIYNSAKIFKTPATNEWGCTFAYDVPVDESGKAWLIVHVRRPTGHLILEHRHLIRITLGPGVVC